MSGHSHWSTIKRKKEAKDHEKGKLFSQASKEIMLAISQGGGQTDPDKNVRLRAAIERTKEINMPKDNIDRIMKRVTEKQEHVSEVVYEALGPGNSSFVIKTVTDNSRRTQTSLKVILDKNGGKLVAKGTIMHGYDLCGMFEIEGYSEAEVLKLIEAIQAFDFETINHTYFVYVPYSILSEAWQKAREMGFKKAPELIYKPKNLIRLDEKQVQKVISLAERIEELEDTQQVFMNVDLS